MIAINNRINTCPTHLENIRMGAYRGARKLLRFRHEHSVCIDIASDAVASALKTEKPIEKPEAWGKLFGRRKAVSHVRKCTSERRYKSNRVLTGTGLAEDNAKTIQCNDQAHFVARRTLELLPPKDALYVLSCTLCEYQVEELGLIIDQIEDVDRTKKMHDKQLAAAIKKLQFHMRC